MAAGSLFFDGTSNYLALSSNTSILALGTSNFTVEAWLYVKDYANTNMILSRADTANSSTGNAAGSWIFAINNGTGQLMWGHSTTDYWPSTGPIVPLNTWCHVAWVRSGTTITGWLNGVQGVTQTLSIDLSGLGEVRVGRGRGTSGNFFSGYISNLRVTIGTALYSSTFTPPTAPLNPVSGTQLLLGKDFEANNNIPDYSANSFVFTKVGNTTLGTSVISPSTPNPTLVDSLSLSQAPYSQFSNYMSPSAVKTLYLGTSDALLDRSVINPADAYSLS